MYCLSMCEIFHFYCRQKLFSAQKIPAPLPSRMNGPSVCLPPDDGPWNNCHELHIVQFVPLTLELFARTEIIPDKRCR